MKIISGDDIPTRVLIKKLKEDSISKSGLTIPLDNDALPQAEVIMISEKAEGILAVGDRVYYMETREKGRVKYEGEDHFLVPIGNIISVISSVTKLN
tara:strand:+ start:1967 stop:2257 length:291 start_codon:yes stop_codon:yes gene_type:complete